MRDEPCDAALNGLSLLYSLEITVLYRFECIMYEIYSLGVE